MGIAFFCVIVNTVATLTGSYMLLPDHQPLYCTAGRKSRKCGGTF